ncbi:MAG: MgtC/SapB family protein [Candidatus Kapabacteria bacterium]|nr:MgtC/SapB family protein [Candidatus Kapabacteria bacterium]
MNADLFPWLTLGIALLIGVLVGAERESSKSHAGIGLRDIVLASAVGWISARLQEPLIGLAFFGGLVALMLIHRPRDGSVLGVTTEFAVVAVFAMSYVLGGITTQSSIAIVVALAIALTLLLDAKASVKRVFRELITEKEFADTVRFLAIIFIIMPLLPEGRFGPYEFFAPRTLWIAVILVTGVSYVGYFLEKFLGVKHGTWLVAVLGGMVSTTVMTQTFAKQAAADPQRLRISWQAATLSNSIQFPRLLVLLFVTSPSLAQIAFPALLPAFIVGVLLSLLLARGSASDMKGDSVLKNPLRLVPALQFALFMAGVTFIGAAAYEFVGERGLYITSAIGAILDVDAIALSTADRVSSGLLDVFTGQNLILVAVGSNMIVKSVLAYVSGSRGFFLRMCLSFIVMLVAAVTGVLLFG